MTLVMNAQTGETDLFYDSEKETFTIRQWHKEEGAPDGGVEHYVTTSALMLARMAEEVGIAMVEIVDDGDES